MSTDFIAGIMFGIGVIGLIDKAHNELGPIIIFGTALFLIPRLAKFVMENGT